MAWSELDVLLHVSEFCGALILLIEKKTNTNTNTNTNSKQKHYEETDL